MTTTPTPPAAAQIVEIVALPIELALAEVLRDYHYVMPVYGARRLAEAALTALTAAGLSVVASAEAEGWRPIEDDVQAIARMLLANPDKMVIDYPTAEGGRYQQRAWQNKIDEAALYADRLRKAGVKLMRLTPPEGV